MSSRGLRCEIEDGENEWVVKGRMMGGARETYLYPGIVLVVLVFDLAAIDMLTFGWWCDIVGGAKRALPIFHLDDGR